jgi:hypothetical protein
MRPRKRALTFLNNSETAGSQAIAIRGMSRGAISIWGDTSEEAMKNIGQVLHICRCDGSPVNPIRLPTYSDERVQ